MADTIQKGSSGLNVANSVKNLTEKGAKNAHSSGRCALFIREALLAGGVRLVKYPEQAKGYGDYLTDNGFIEIPSDGYTPAAGDIVVIQPYKGGNPAGHITMFDGENWVSDFLQRDMWSGPGYRTNKPSYEIYRP